MVLLNRIHFIYGVNESQLANWHRKLMCDRKKIELRKSVAIKPNIHYYAAYLVRSQCGFSADRSLTLVYGWKINLQHLIHRLFHTAFRLA